MMHGMFSVQRPGGKASNPVGSLGLETNNEHGVPGASVLQKQGDSCMTEF